MLVAGEHVHVQLHVCEWSAGVRVQSSICVNDGRACLLLMKMELCTCACALAAYTKPSPPPPPPRQSAKLEKLGTTGLEGRICIRKD